jgi:zinc/manganese transport system substrate-binding protein
MAILRYVITLVLGCMSVVSAWQAKAQAPDKLPVVATFSVLADFARNVGGERIEVAALVGPNSDTHVYQPKPADAKELGAARLILVNGFGLEGWIDRLIKASGRRHLSSSRRKELSRSKCARKGASN